MSKLDELIQKLCPNGVKYKPFYNVCKYIRGITYNKANEITTDTGIRVLRANNITLSSNLLNFEDMKFVSNEVRIKKEQWLKKGDILICAGSGSKEHIGKVAYIFDDIDYTFGGFMGVIRTNQNEFDSRFLFHILTSDLFKKHLHKVSGAASSTINNINNDTFSDLRIPVPPMEVQCEIVHILDQFTLLTAELTAELTARKKQYEFYRDKLLSFDNLEVGAIRYMAFGEVATIVRGASPRPIANFITDDPSGVNWIKIGDVEAGAKYITKSAERITKEGAMHSRKVKKGDFILSNSMSFGRPYILGIDGCVHDGWLVISDFDTYFYPDFLYHVLNSTSLQNEMKRKASFGGAVQNLNSDIVKSLILPVPSIELQKKIAMVLDNFDAICSDLNIGLPAEISARNKQYEYYRDRLLTFNLDVSGESELVRGGVN